MQEIVPDATINEKGSLLSQLEELVKQVKEPGIETSEYLMQVHRKNMENNIIEDLLQSIALDNVSLSKLIAKLENGLKNIISLFQKIFLLSNYTGEIKKKDESIEKEITE